MQILGKRSKILLIAVAIAMLAALGLSFALWDIQAVKASSGSLSEYANAKVGDIIEFGQYYQTANSADKSPITWIVVDKDERTGQITLLSEKILANGNYFGNWYYNSKGAWTSSYTADDGTTKNMDDLVAGLPYNQVWAESTARAFLNNLERFDLGGDIFNATEGLSATRENSVVYTLTSEANSMRIGDLKASVGFSNAKYWTGLSYANADTKKLVDNSSEFMTRSDKEGVDDVYYQRVKITNPDDRLARNGFLDEAFSDAERQRIVPRNIPGAISHRWPGNENFLKQAEYVEGTTDRVWLPSVEELNIKEGTDWVGRPDDSWTTPSDLSSSEAFEYFRNYKNYGFTTLADAIKTTHTSFSGQGSGLGDYSIPGFVSADQIGNNTSDAYWTRSASSHWYGIMRTVGSSGDFTAWNYPSYSHLGVRPCVIVKY